MELVSSATDLRSGMHAVSSTIARWFPLPEALFPSAAGVDISDTSLKWIMLGKAHKGEEYVRTWGSLELPAGIIVNGHIKDVHALAHALSDMKSNLGGIEHVHVSLPEEFAYVFSMHVPESSSREQILSVIEFELEGRVPISPSAAIFDFDVIQVHDDGVGEEIGVVVFPKDLAESYAEAFSKANIKLLSLELEARSIARAVSSGQADEPITLLVDFGRVRAGLTVLKRGVPIFTSTVMVGSQTMDRALKEKLSFSPEEVIAFKNEEGVFAKGGKNSPGVEAIAGTTSALAEEVVRHHHYWDTRRNERGERMTPVERVLLVGGNANIKGLDDYIAARVQVEVLRPNVWQNVCSFEDYIPPIDRHISLEYATAIGLALRGL